MTLSQSILHVYEFSFFVAHTMQDKDPMGGFRPDARPTFQTQKRRAPGLLSASMDTLLDAVPLFCDTDLVSFVVKRSSPASQPGFLFGFRGPGTFHEFTSL